MCEHGVAPRPRGSHDVAGDVLLSLNDKPTEDYDMASLGKLFRSAEPLQMTIDRDGEIRTIEVE